MYGMTDLKANDLSKDGQEIVRYEKAYRVNVYSFGNKTNIEFDTKLDQSLGTLKDSIALAIQNGKTWVEVKWVKDEVTGKLKKVETPVAQQKIDPTVG